MIVVHDLSNFTAGVGRPHGPEVLWTPEEVVLEGFSTALREIAIRPTAAGALDNVVRLVPGG